MNNAEIIVTQKRVGTPADGDWGPLSTAACQRHLRRIEPHPSPFPLENSRAFEVFYGPHGVKDGYTPPSKIIRLPFSLWLYGNPKKLVPVLRVHEKCADSLLGVFEILASALPTERLRKEAGVLCYDGLYNPRLKRGSATKWSMHAWMCAIDLNAAQNGNLEHWPTSAEMPLIVMECFVKCGWLPAGAFWSRDAMHFQATDIPNL